MSDLKAIKKRILKEDKIEQIYEAMGCEYMSIRRNRIEAQLPPQFHSDNRRSVQTKFNEHLSSSIRNRSFSGDIYSLVSYIVHNKRTEQEFTSDLPNAKKFICETLGWREFLKGGDYERRTDHVAPLKAILKGKQRRQEVKPNPVLPESILDEYLPYPSFDWMKEGISYQTQKLYDVRFDLESKRIILPMRNRFGELVGVKGRILHDEDDERKYLYLHQFNNSQELFNFHYAHPYILMEKRVYIFEGEKSVLKMHDAGVFNAVAFGSSDLSDVQAQIIRQCGLDIEIVLCYDTDKFPKEVSSKVMEEINKGEGIKSMPEEVKKAVELFTGRKVYAIIDMQGHLGEKESPIDRGLDLFQVLEREHCYPIRLAV
jgi:DNA primase